MDCIINLINSMGYLQYIYHNIFYWTFLMHKKEGGKVSDVMALFFSIFYISLLNTMNVEFVFCLINRITLLSFKFPPSRVFVEILMCGLVNCIIFVRKKRYKYIIYTCDHLDKKKRIAGVIICVSYWIASVFLIVIALPKA